MGIENSYSGLDRLLHRLSFSTTAVQIDLAELEERLFAKQVADVAASSPVFITALPRAVKELWAADSAVSIVGLFLDVSTVATGGGGKIS